MIAPSSLAYDIVQSGLPECSRMESARHGSQFTTSIPCVQIHSIWSLAGICLRPRTQRRERLPRSLAVGSAPKKSPVDGSRRATRPHRPARLAVGAAWECTIFASFQCELFRLSFSNFQILLSTKFRNFVSMPTLQICFQLAQH